MTAEGKQPVVSTQSAEQGAGGRTMSLDVPYIDGDLRVVVGEGNRDGIGFLDVMLYDQGDWHRLGWYTGGGIIRDDGTVWQPTQEQIERWTKRPSISAPSATAKD